MPVFEYKCNVCNKIFEVLHKSSNNSEEIVCPKCKSKNYTKLFSAFSASVKGNTSMTFNDTTCSNGSCCMNDGGSCSNN